MLPSNSPRTDPKKTPHLPTNGSSERNPKKTPRCIATAHRRLATYTQTRPARFAFIYIDFNHNWNISITFNTLSPYQNSWKFSDSGAPSCERTDTANLCAPQDSERAKKWRQGLKQQAISFWFLNLKSCYQPHLTKYSTVSTCTDATATGGVSMPYHR
jgi:hypothetical protein